MAKLYSQNGKIVSNNTKLGTSQGCCCGGVPCSTECGGWDIDSAQNYYLNVNTNVGNIIMPPGVPGDSSWSYNGWSVQWACTPYMTCESVILDDTIYIIVSNFSLSFYADGFIMQKPEGEPCVQGNLNGITISVENCDGSNTGSVTFRLI